MGNGDWVRNQQCPLQKNEFNECGEVFIDLGNLESSHDTCRFTNGNESRINMVGD